MATHDGDNMDSAYVPDEHNLLASLRQYSKQTDVQSSADFVNRVMRVLPEEQSSRFSIREFFEAFLRPASWGVAGAFVVGVFLFLQLATLDTSQTDSTDSNIVLNGADDDGMYAVSVGEDQDYQYLFYGSANSNRSAS